MEQMKIMFDMDDVLVSVGFLYLINSYLGTHYKESDFKTYYMQDIVPDKEAFLSISYSTIYMIMRLLQKVLLNC